MISTSTGPWWRDAVCYEIYVRSFADSTGDGLGDLRGITSRLGHLVDLGVDAVWLTPFYVSPQADQGYDVADYRAVDPRFGNLADFDALRAETARLGLRLMVDIVPNHTSVQHPWFQAALAAGPGSPERARYFFRPGRGRDGGSPPNNWKSLFGGPAWARVRDGEWYLHLFDVSQADLDWRNPEVGQEFDATLRFWLDRGVDGFRVDVAHGLIKPIGLPNSTRADPHPYWDNPEVHEIYRRWRTLLDAYPGDRMAVAEAWVDSPQDMARYVRPDELQQVFNFRWLEAPWSAAAFRRVVQQTLAAVTPVHAEPSWVLGNHDVIRPVTRYGGGRLGTTRLRAAVLTMLALPGSAYVYQGEELGLPQVDVPPKDRRDPTWLRGGGVGRDGCRVPIPWSGDAPPYGFGPPGGASWLPQPPEWQQLSVEREAGEPSSTFRFYQRALAARRTTVVGLDTDVALLDSPAGVLAFARKPGFVCAINCGARPARLPPVGKLVISSTEAPAVRDGRLAPDTAAWFLAD
jgi:alpha-glucosidase